MDNRFRGPAREIGGLFFQASGKINRVTSSTNRLLRTRYFQILVTLFFTGLVGAACTPTRGAQADASLQDLRSTRSSATPVSVSSTPDATPTHPLPAAATTAPPPAAPKETETPAPSPIPAPTRPVCREPAGRTEEGSLPSDDLPLPLQYKVLLPPCYDQEPGRRYTVLYLIHGQNYNHDQWERLGAGVRRDALIAAGELPPFIIVLPRDRSWSQPTEDLYGKVVAENLVPLIDGSYRTRPDRRFRAVGGLSRGAGWAVHLGITRPDLFGALGAHSLPVFHTDALHMRQWLDELPADRAPRIYMDIGDRDRPEIMRSAVWFEELLTEKGIPHEWHLFPGYHEEAYWEAHLDEYLRWYAREWQSNPLVEQRIPR